MKRILILMFALVLSTTLSAQKKKGKKDKAKKVTTEMTEVLSLNEATSSEIYAVQSEKFAEIKVASKAYKDDKAALKTKKKEINKNYSNKIRSILGKDNAMKWSAHLKEKKSQKKKKKK